MLRLFSIEDMAVTEITMASPKQTFLIQVGTIANYLLVRKPSNKPPNVLNS